MSLCINCFHHDVCGYASTKVFDTDCDYRVDEKTIIDAASVFHKKDSIREQLKTAFRDKITELCEQKIERYECSGKDIPRIKSEVLRDLFGTSFEKGFFDEVIDLIGKYLELSETRLKKAEAIKESAEEETKKANDILKLKNKKAREAVKFGTALGKLLEPMDESLRKSVGCDIYAFLCGEKNSDEVYEELEVLNE